MILTSPSPILLLMYFIACIVFFRLILFFPHSCFFGRLRPCHPPVKRRRRRLLNAPLCLWKKTNSAGENNSSKRKTQETKKHTDKTLRELEIFQELKMSIFVPLFYRFKHFFSGFPRRTNNKNMAKLFFIRAIPFR